MASDLPAPFLDRSAAHTEAQTRRQHHSRPGYLDREVVIAASQRELDRLGKREARRHGWALFGLGVLWLCFWVAVVWIAIVAL